MKLALRGGCEGNYKHVGEYKEHTLKVWDILSDWSKKAVQTARKAK